MSKASIILFLCLLFTCFSGAGGLGVNFSNPDLERAARDMMADRKRAERFDVEEPHKSVSELVKKAYKKKELAGDALWKELIESSARTRQISIWKIIGG